MTQKVQGAQSFARAVQVLRRIADAPSPPRLTDLLRDEAFTRPTLHRVLASLEAEHMIRRSDDKRYHLDVGLISLAHRALAQQDVRTVAHDSLMALRDETGETVHLAVRSGDRMVYIDKIESGQTVRMASSVGTSVAMHSSSVGRAWLSALSKDARETVIEGLTLAAFTPQTITDLGVLKEATAQGARDGYCVESEENEAGIVCCGAAIVDGRERPIAAVSVSIPTFRVASDKRKYTAPLVRCCERVSALIGWPGRVVTR